MKTLALCLKRKKYPRIPKFVAFQIIKHMKHEYVLYEELRRGKYVRHNIKSAMIMGCYSYLEGVSYDHLKLYYATKYDDHYQIFRNRNAKILYSSRKIINNVYCFCSKGILHYFLDGTLRPRTWKVFKSRKYKIIMNFLNSPYITTLDITKGVLYLIKHNVTDLMAKLTITWGKVSCILYSCLKFIKGDQEKIIEVFESQLMTASYIGATDFLKEHFKYFQYNASFEWECIKMAIRNNQIEVLKILAPNADYRLIKRASKYGRFKILEHYNDMDINILYYNGYIK